MAEQVVPALPPAESFSRRPVFGRAVLWIGIVAIIASLVVIGYLCFLFKRKLSKYCKLWQNRKDELDAEKLSLKRFQLEELQKATNNFGEECKVGSGAFGDVYVGWFKVQGSLAIKKLHPYSRTSLEEFRNEVRLISKVKHENLVRLVGFCEESGNQGENVMVYEYVSNGSLLDYLRGRGGRILTWKQRVNIAIGAAKVYMQARPNLEEGRIEEIIDANLLIEECNMEMMLQMGQLGLRCVVDTPKERPTMTQVWQELETALQSVVLKQPLSTPQKLENSLTASVVVLDKFPAVIDEPYSQNSSSIDDTRVERFQVDEVDEDPPSFQSPSLRCFEYSISIDAAANYLKGEVTSQSMDEGSSSCLIEPHS
ncbi:OLC1v1011127C1 [Oldenlandia corymbosa var. corymbosa]|uniref:OLC1v1011127C1 n=1 Tax=Oldenlandia corymbosa var. corymbosa TaxID=529605 RepID=A0AAV1DSZ2_OLDCO|nr:OLC1v1011127C1 [Oldenlandia corymbosa var. corymbosa]